MYTAASLDATAKFIQGHWKSLSTTFRGVPLTVKRESRMGGGLEDVANCRAVFLPYLLLWIFWVGQLNRMMTKTKKAKKSEKNHRKISVIKTNCGVYQYWRLSWSGALREVLWQLWRQAQAVWWVSVSTRRRGWVETRPLIQGGRHLQHHHHYLHHRRHHLNQWTDAKCWLFSQTPRLCPSATKRP